MQTSFKNNNSDELILLLDGWGMDENPYKPLESNCDVLFVFDYSNLEFDFDFSKYKKITLIAFSAGVFMAGYLKDRLPKFDYSVAINGTLKLFNPQLGLPQSSRSMMENINEKNCLELRKKLIYGKKHLALFDKNQPHREIKSSLSELSSLKKYYSQAKDIKFDFDKVIIGQNDEIIPYQNQYKAWTNHKNKRIMQGGHFLFYNFNDFDKIINL